MSVCDKCEISEKYATCICCSHCEEMFSGEIPDDWCEDCEMKKGVVFPKNQEK